MWTQSLSSLIQSWGRPLLILLCGMLLINLPTLLYKIRLSFNGLLFLMLSKDKRWPKQNAKDPGPLFAKLSKEEPSSGKLVRKTIYFVRHGESTWNDTFNKGKHRSTIVFVIGFIPNLVKAVLYELYLLLSGKMDSWFYDAPLSEVGLAQVQDLYSYLSKKQSRDALQSSRSLSILRGDSPGKSKIVCSNLRRAVSTTVGAFQHRLAGGSEKILILPSLQEISHNPDALTLVPPYCPFEASWLEERSWKRITDKKNSRSYFRLLNRSVDVSLHCGNKPLSSNGLERMQDFCRSVFESIPQQHVIVGGHSLWFRSFFQTFLPHQVEVTAKKKKMVNCGVVQFDLLQSPDRQNYMIDPKSIQVVYGGFSS